MARDPLSSVVNFKIVYNTVSVVHVCLIGPNEWLTVDICLI